MLGNNELNNLYKYQGNKKSFINKQKKASNIKRLGSIWFIQWKLWKKLKENYLKKEINLYRTL